MSNLPRSLAPTTFLFKFKALAKNFVDQLTKIDGSPHKISLGLALGVFLGILPGAGPVASLAMAYVFRVNRAAALLGSVLTNTWLSVVIFVVAVKTGSIIFHSDWHQTQDIWLELTHDFQWKDLWVWDSSILKLLWPVAVGYIVVGMGIGFMTYLMALLILKQREKRLRKIWERNKKS